LIGRKSLRDPGRTDTRVVDEDIETLRLGQHGADSGIYRRITRDIEFHDVDVLRSKGRGVCAIAAVDHFYYVKDHWNSYCEYSYGIDYVPAQIDWDSANHPPEDAFYLWGPELPEDFELNHEQ